MRRPYNFILVIALMIAVIGVVSIYSSTFQNPDKPWQNIYQRQILWIILGAGVFFLFSNLNYRRLWDFNYLLYAAMMVLLILVFILGAVRLGAQRWLRFAWFNFQPSEFAKIILLIFLARYFSRKSPYDVSLASKKFGLGKGLIVPFIFTAVPVLLIIEQPDLGSGLMIMFLLIAFLFLTNVRLRYIIIFVVLILIPLPFMWGLLREYQKQRLLVFLNPNIDPLGAGYTVIQSKIAIGSSGFFGKGWLSGTQSQLHFLPESHTDFIFATFAEEWGVLGSLVLFSLYFLLIHRGFSIARRTEDPFGRLLALGISLMLCIQVGINVAMNMGLAPVVGLPLPLMSYGGSSMAVTFIALGVLANIDKTRAVF